MLNTFIIVVWTFHIYFSTITQAADCNGNTRVGKDNPDSNKMTGETDTYFLATGYMIDCCGVLDTWYYDADVENEEVELHVWRPTTGDNFRLISTTKHTANKDNKQTVTPVNFPLVLPGDRLGWYSTVDVIGYKTGGNDANAIYLPATSVNTAGDVTWVGTTVSQEWAIGARLGE
ncbi:uncharacterized protein LOC132758992, partial [Ruditapes philippinarum]|uniref:uncharacterized protein LOC132758992 n=1 Tax=Ruditapes philippinarum TaxID=129788 RepID=UPI00295A779D